MSLKLDQSHIMPDNFSLDGSGSEHSSRLLDKIEREYSYTELNHGPESGFSSPSEPGDLKTSEFTSYQILQL